MPTPPDAAWEPRGDSAWPSEKYDGNMTTTQRLATVSCPGTTCRGMRRRITPLSRSAQYALPVAWPDAQDIDHLPGQQSNCPLSFLRSKRDVRRPPETVRAVAGIIDKCLLRLLPGSAHRRCVAPRRPRWSKRQKVGLRGSPATVSPLRRPAKHHLWRR